MSDTVVPPAPRRQHWRDRVFRWRDRLVGDPAFQAWAARFPLTRPKARRNATRLFDLAAGFVYAQTLGACVKLDLFDRLADGPLTAAEIGRASGLTADAATRLLGAAAAVGLLTRTGERWRLTELGAAVRGAPGVVEMVRHHEMFYADLADPVALLRGETGPTRLGAFWGYAGGRTDALGSCDTDGYSRLMASSQDMVAAEVLAAYDLGRHRKLLDVGGGHGAFLRAVADRHPGLGLCLFDLPAVAARARDHLAEAEVHAEVIGGDFLSESLPTGADIVSLVRIVHDHDDPAALRLLRAVHSALAPGGTVLIAEPLAGEASNRRVADAYFGFYMLAMGAGRPRRFDELSRLLQSAGFRKVQRHGYGGFLSQTVSAKRL